QVDREGETLFIPVKLKERQSLVVPKLGLEVKNLSEEDKKIYKIKRGVKIIGVPEGYREHDLKGKVIISVNREEVKNIQDANTLFGKLPRYRKSSFTTLDAKGERERIIFQ
ncbi:MAG: serine protease, partial [Eudoraea sp.]|nr:serine protease [Eudoraea sp.]